MRIGVFSDLHLEYCDWAPPPLDADVIVLAGDIHIGAQALPWARRAFGSTPIIYVAGNHEFFGAEIGRMRERLRQSARDHDIRLLDQDATIIGAVRFLGATLWTDFEFYGCSAAEVARAMHDARTGMHDYRTIRCDGGGRLTPEHTRALHREQADWLQRQIDAPFAGVTVVVSHHLPHALSVHRKFDSDRLNPAFASDLSRLVRDPVRLWIHGHTHESIDYRIGGTRVLCNPRGYLPRQPNPDFIADLIVEVAAERPGGT